MNPLKILIVEDELIIAEDLKMIVKRLGYEVIGTATTFYKAEELIRTLNPSLVLIDILLKGDKSGIDVAEYIRANYSIPFIFVTSFADRKTVEKAKLTQPNGYLLKPFEAEDIYITIEIAISNFNQNETKTNDVVMNNCIFIKEGTLLTKIYFSDILWLQSDGNYVEIYTTQKKHLLRSALKEVSKKLPEHTFIQVHKSYVVNIHQIQSVASNHLVLADKEIPLGRIYREDLINKLSNQVS